MYKKVF